MKKLVFVVINLCVSLSSTAMQSATLPIYIPLADSDDRKDSPSKPAYFSPGNLSLLEKKQPEITKLKKKSITREQRLLK